MSEPAIDVTFERGHRSFAPGAEVAGTVRVTAGDPLGKTELMLLWYTDGKGDSDLGVVHHELLADDETTREIEKPFRVRLPLLPLSYSGTLLHVRWVVRVRIYGFLGRDHVVDSELKVTDR
jgi:hypothetical protein